MKFWVLLLSVYVVILSTDTCCKDYSANWGCQTEQHEAGDLPDDDCSGVCSPFCACIACVGFSIEPALSYFQSKPTQASSEINTHYQRIYSLSLTQNIWQPPKW